MNANALERKLGELCDFEQGSSPTLKTEPGPYPLVVTAEYRRSASTFQLEGPSVCIPLVSSTGHGDAALHRVHFQDGKFALANLLVALQPRPASGLHAKYLYYLLTAQKDRLLVPLMRGSANVSLKAKDIADVAIIVPPLVLQRRIVAKIERLSMMIEEARSLTVGVDAKAAVFPTSLHDNLSQGRLRRLDQLIELDEERVPVECDCDYPQIGIRGFGGGLFHKSATRGSDTTYKYFNRIRDGQLVLSQVKGWEGAIAVATEEEAGWFASPEYRTFTCIENECIPQYLDRIVRTSWFRSQLTTATRGQGARRERTRPEMLLGIEIPFPEKCQQQKVLRWLDSIHGITQSHRHSSRILEAMVPSILDRAFRAEL